MSVSDQTKAVTDYITRRYGPGTNRNWWAIAHRAQLLSSGEYVYTTRPSERAMRRTKTGIGNLIVGEAGPELVPLRGGGLLKGRPRQGDPLLRLYPHEYIVNPDGSVWQVDADGERIELIRGPRKDDE